MSAKSSERLVRIGWLRRNILRQRCCNCGIRIYRWARVSPNIVGLLTPGLATGRSHDWCCIDTDYCEERVKGTDEASKVRETLAGVEELRARDSA